MLVMKPEIVAGGMGHQGNLGQNTGTEPGCVSLGRQQPLHWGPGPPKAGHCQPSYCGDTDRQTAGVRQLEGAQGLEEWEMNVTSRAELACSQVPPSRCPPEPL